jgi:hypothetical protein
MAGTDKKKQPRTGSKELAGDTPKKKPPPLQDDEDHEDGDIATPKKDRYGTDDEPL